MQVGGVGVAQAYHVAVPIVQGYVRRGREVGVRVPVVAADGQADDAAGALLGAGEVRAPGEVSSTSGKTDLPTMIEYLCAYWLPANAGFGSVFQVILRCLRRACNLLFNEHLAATSKILVESQPYAACQPDTQSLLSRFDIVEAHQTLGGRSRAAWYICALQPLAAK